VDFGVKAQVEHRKRIGSQPWQLNSQPQQNTFTQQTHQRSSTISQNYGEHDISTQRRNSGDINYQYYLLEGDQQISNDLRKETEDDPRPISPATETLGNLLFSEINQFAKDYTKNMQDIMNRDRGMPNYMQSYWRKQENRKDENSKSGSIDAGRENGLLT